jgi:hypothetical protein
MRPLLLLIITWLVSVPAYAQPLLLEEPTDYDDFNQTMVTFERAFATRDARLLDDIATQRFRRTSFYQRLRDSVSCCRINSAYSSRTSEQVFQVGKDELTVRFGYRDQKWVISDALINGKRPSDRGFSSVAAQFYFSDFRDLVASGKAGGFAGLAPHGRLNAQFFKGKKISSRAGTAVTFLNLILHDGASPRELFFLRLRQFSEVNEKRRGWLIDDGDTMLSYRRREAPDPLIEFLADGPKAFDLSRTSTFHYVNAAAPESERNALYVSSTHRVSRVRVTDINLAKKAEGLMIFVFDIIGPPLDTSAIQAKVVDGSLIIGAPPDVSFTTDSSHPYLALSASGTELRLSVRAGVTAPIRTFNGSSVTEVTSVPSTDTYRIRLRVVLPPSSGT